jgi:hypothetical protein
VQRRRKERRAPSAVPAGRTEAHVFGIDDDDVGIGCLGQVVRRPQAGVAGADDRNVIPTIAGELGPVSRWRLIEPQGTRGGAQRTPQEYVCLRSCRYMNVSVVSTPSIDRIRFEMRSSRASSLSQTASTKRSNVPAVMTT